MPDRKGNFAFKDPKLQCLVYRVELDIEQQQDKINKHRVIEKGVRGTASETQTYHVRATYKAALVQPSQPPPPPTSPYPYSAKAAPQSQTQASLPPPPAYRSIVPVSQTHLTQPTIFSDLMSSRPMKKPTSHNQPRTLTTKMN